MRVVQGVNVFHWLYQRWLKIQLSFMDPQVLDPLCGMLKESGKEFFLLDCLSRCLWPMVSRALIVFLRLCTVTYVMGCAQEILFHKFVT